MRPFRRPAAAKPWLKKGSAWGGLWAESERFSYPFLVNLVCRLVRNWFLVLDPNLQLTSCHQLLPNGFGSELRFTFFDVYIAWSI